MLEVRMLAAVIHARRARRMPDLRSRRLLQPHTGPARDLCDLRAPEPQRIVRLMNPREKTLVVVGFALTAFVIFLAALTHC